METDTSERPPGSLSARIRALLHAIEDGDEATVEQAILRLSRSRRVFARSRSRSGHSCCCSTGCD